MRKLLIVDPTLRSLEGHSYNYDLAIQRAARPDFDAAPVYADRAFVDASGELTDVHPVLNRLRIDGMKRTVNALFHRQAAKPRADATSVHSTVVPGVWPWMIGLAKWLRARDLEWSLRAILRE